MELPHAATEPPTKPAGEGARAGRTHTYTPKKNSTSSPGMKLGWPHVGELAEDILDRWQKIIEALQSGAAKHISIPFLQALGDCLEKQRATGKGKVQLTRIQAWLKGANLQFFFLLKGRFCALKCPAYRIPSLKTEVKPRKEWFGGDKSGSPMVRDKSWLQNDPLVLSWTGNWRWSVPTNPNPSSGSDHSSTSSTDMNFSSFGFTSKEKELQLG